jgi:hypothetical protein
MIEIEITGPVDSVRPTKKNECGVEFWTDFYCSRGKKNSVQCFFSHVSSISAKEGCNIFGITADLFPDLMG